MCSVEIEKLSTVNLQIKNIVQELREALEALYGARLKRLVLYGSHARGEATDNSDIDVMVVLDGDVSAWEEITRMNDVVTELCLKHGVSISLYPLAESDYLAKQSLVLRNVHREGVML